MTVVFTLPQTAGPPLPRRTLLRGAAVLAFATASAGCGVFSGPTERPSPPPADLRADPLLPVAAAARADAAMAARVVPSAPAQAATLAVIATERSAHADALESEIARAAGVVTPGTAATFAPPLPPSTVPAVPAPNPEPTVAALRLSLGGNQQTAAELARTVPAYRAGLLGSIAAACATTLTVLA